MIEREKSREIKTCCATFYQSDVVRLLLGEVLHPGGLELTRYLGMVVELKPEDKPLGHPSQLQILLQNDPFRQTCRPFAGVFARL